MALATSLAVLLAVLAFALTTSLFGHRVLRHCGWPFGSAVEDLLYSAGIGTIVVQVLLFFVQPFRHIRIGAIAVLGFVLLIGAPELPRVAPKVAGAVQRILAGSKLERVLAVLTAVVLLLIGLAAMAPVSGSDALHYHFTVPSLILQSGFHPDFFLSHSFFTGQTHLLILSALALGTSEFAMGLLFLGGVLSAAAAAGLARRWTTREWSWTVALAFLLTPVVFWQISTAGAPDIWMAFFATTGVLAISKAQHIPLKFHALLAGAFSGAVAGTKYTGCVIAAAMAVAYIWEARSTLKSFIFLGGSLVAGVYPYARNFAWSGDPVFPFLTRWLYPNKVNTFALTSYLNDTGAGRHIHLWQVAGFPFFSAIDRAHLGFWQFLGPLVLAFAPLLALVVRNTPAWRASIAVWFISSLAIGGTSGMLRFLLPVLPIALAATFAGVAQLKAGGRRVAHFISLASLFSFLLFGSAAFVLYARSAVAVAAGLSSRESYLRQHVQEYSIVEFINRTLLGSTYQGKTLVFLRHLYYLRVPFVLADPHASWAVDPAKLQTPQAWQAFFREQGVRWVVRAPDYPPEIAAPLEELEAEGKLTPVAQSIVSDLSGLRLAGERESVQVLVLRVNE